MEGKLCIMGVEGKERFLEELRKIYGGDKTLRDIQFDFKNRCLSTPIEECRFTGVDGPDGEFTGTIKEIVKEIYEMKKAELTNQEIVDWLVDVFTNGEQWVSYGDGTKYSTVRCVPVDRVLTEPEVRAYLRHLAEEI